MLTEKPDKFQGSWKGNGGSSFLGALGRWISPLGAANQWARSEI